MERFLHPRESPTSSSETQKQTPKRQRKYDETFLQYGFTSITENNEEKPKCLLCSNVLSTESMKPNKLKRHFETTHKEYVGKPKSFLIERNRSCIREWRWRNSGLAQEKRSQCALKLLVPFGSTYLCEAGFSPFVCMKSKYRSQLDVTAEMRCTLSTIPVVLKVGCANTLYS